VPYLDFRAPGWGKTVAISQRQLAFLVANALMGNSIPAGDGLSAMIRRCSKRKTQGSNLLSLLSLLAVLSQELTEPNMAQGSILVAATPQQGPPVKPDWRGLLTNRTLELPHVCTQVGQQTKCDLEDFMSGGTPFQALTDIAGTVVGGGGQLCEVADSQDESLVIFYSEVLAFSFFAGIGPDMTHMLPVPMALLGTRRYVSSIRGETSAGPPFGNRCGNIDKADWLNQAIDKAGTVNVQLDGERVSLAAGAFVAVASVSSNAKQDCPLEKAVNNECQNQRNHLDMDISLWYQAYRAPNYGPVAEQAFRHVVHRIGTGPWGAGVWYGDSQQYFLAVWLATSLLDGPTLDYYLYDHFCENPSNQCFLLGGQDCTNCIMGSKVDALPRSSARRCGRASIWDMISQFKGRPAQDLYTALTSMAGPPEQVFDLLWDKQLRPPVQEPAVQAMTTTAAIIATTTQAATTTTAVSETAQAQPTAGGAGGNHYRWDPNVGGWGGICTCPDGRRYEVGDQKDYCASLACEGGTSGVCSEQGIQPSNKGMKVICTAPVPQATTQQVNFYRKEEGAVGWWGGICTCPDGQQYEVGDNNDNCSSLACEFGVPGNCSGELRPESRSMMVTCVQKEAATTATKLSTITQELLPESWPSSQQRFLA